MNLTNLTFTQGVIFNQTYKIKASQHVSGSISGLPDGISGDIRNNIIRIRGIANTISSGELTIIIDGINYTRPWTVIAADREIRTRGVPRQTRQSSFNMDDAVLYINEDFDVTGTYSGNPTNIYVEGLLRNWTYTWGSGTIHVLGDADDVTRIETGIWKIIIDGVEYMANWRVGERAPVITNPGTQVFNADEEIDLDIDISGEPSGLSMEGLQAKMFYERIDGGIGLRGSPDRAITPSENREIIINASTSGGTDTESFDFSVLGAPITSFDLPSENDSANGISVDSEFVYVSQRDGDSLIIYKYDILTGNFVETITWNTTNTPDKGLKILNGRFYTSTFSVSGNSRSYHIERKGSGSTSDAVRTVASNVTRVYLGLTASTTHIYMLMTTNFSFTNYVLYRVPTDLSSQVTRNWGSGAHRNGLFWKNGYFYIDSNSVPEFYAYTESGSRSSSNDLECLDLTSLDFIDELNDKIYYISSGSLSGTVRIRTLF